ncbi:HdeD family acid-resistance protein [Diaminobutyricibacter sp. McL0608]|uniref:HdeD family acid-resistance protein n=1 Tax=Leifsonia sp. McL0608 TaxID=3143537 RepID=UPI0031F332D8
MTSVDPLDAEPTYFSLDARDLTRSAINGIRAAFAVSGIVALVFGILLLFWPDRTLSVLAIFLGIYFLIAGIVRLALGIFSRGISGGHRTLDILFGLLLVIAGIIAIKNSQTAAAALLILIVAIIGIGWIIEGVMALAESGRAASRGWAITFGIVSVIAGIVVLVIPGWSAFWLLLISAIILIVLGVIGIVRAFTFGRDALKELAAQPK